MEQIAIRVENLGKQFSIGASQSGYKTFREVAVDAFLGPFRRMRSLARGHSAGASDLNDTIWALRDVGFEIRHGEVVGIIGHNGAGKSTLLKILSRITEPTSGFVEVHGRVGSLLEVGTGFHQELTGRENIFLNGAILGMRKAEIERKFDQIVDFAEIDRFLDTPVKHYSTGMQTRLGFAVAAHLDPEILLVDEVLAVGDIGFQNKCLGKMEGVAKSGRTVLFVSHNMAAVTRLCGRALLLRGGKLVEMGDAREMAQVFARSLRGRSARTLSEVDFRKGNGRFRFKELIVGAGTDIPANLVVCGQDVTFEMHYEADDPLRFRDVWLAIGVYDYLGQLVFRCDSHVQGAHYDSVPARGMICCRVPKLPLRPGEYRINISCHINDELADWIPDVATLSVAEGDFFGSGRMFRPPINVAVLVDHKWFPAVTDGKTSTSDHLTGGAPCA
jgi:lipopolysaccharide transport system ATP-binding protein